MVYYEFKEIYKLKTLRSDLQKYKFLGNVFIRDSITENLYRFSKMFSFSSIDRNSNSTIVVRNYVGFMWRKYAKYVNCIKFHTNTFANHQITETLNDHSRFCEKQFYIQTMVMGSFYLETLSFPYWYSVAKRYLLNNFDDFGNFGKHVNAHSKSSIPGNYLTRALYLQINCQNFTIFWQLIRTC